MYSRTTSSYVLILLGVVGMPFAFRNAGVMAGLISCVVIAVVVNVATKMLVWVKRDLLKTRGVTVTSIPEMAGVLLGRSGQNCANALVIACQFGVCIAYNIFIGVSLTAIVEELVPAGNLVLQFTGFTGTKVHILTTASCAAWQVGLRPLRILCGLSGAALQLH